MIERESPTYTGLHPRCLVVFFDRGSDDLLVMVVVAVVVAAAAVLMVVILEVKARDSNVTPADMSCTCSGLTNLSTAQLQPTVTAAKILVMWNSDWS